MPIGALLATDKVSQAFTPGTHGSTFGGNPLACAAAIASIETLIEDNIIIRMCPCSAPTSGRVLRN